MTLEDVLEIVDKEKPVDLDAVQIEMPAEAADPAASEPDLDELFRDRAPASAPAASAPD